MYAKNKFNYYYLMITIQNVVLKTIFLKSSKIFKTVHYGLFGFVGNTPSTVEFHYVFFFTFLLIYILHIYF